jgi:hypothetical protein
MNFPHGVMVTLVSTTVTDDGLGNTTEESVTYEWGPCAIAPRYATESTDPRVAPLIVGKTVMGPPLDVDPADLTISSADSLILPDGTYQVEGLPGEWVSPFTGWAPGLEVQVKKVGA